MVKLPEGQVHLGVKIQHVGVAVVAVLEAIYRSEVGAADGVEVTLVDDPPAFRPMY